MTQPDIRINRLSACSLLIMPATETGTVAAATGFVVDSGNGPHLVTNGHVVTGRGPGGELLDDATPEPTSIVIRHNAAGELGQWTDRSETLYSGGERRWLEHPRGLEIDVVALPMQNLDGVDIHLFPLELAGADVVPEPAMPVSIVGFPFGMSGHGSFPIWKTGHIASEPAIDYEGFPVFLIDATTRGGMSGSPVVLRLMGGYQRADGRRPLREVTRFLGVYSGRIHSDSEVGIVWKPSVVEEILDDA